MKIVPLDFDELLHLAVREIEKNCDEQAISLLKRAIELKPDSSQAYHLLGAMHAQIRLYDRAIEELTQAVKLDPLLDAAHFQLGLLYLTGAQPALAEKAWQALDKLPTSHYFHLFKVGLLNLVQDDFAGCITKLEQGIAANSQNLALNGDMQKLLEMAQESLMLTIQKPVSAKLEDEQIKDRSIGRRVLLTAYERESDETKH